MTELKTTPQGDRKAEGNAPIRWWSRLLVRMTLSFVLVTVMIVLLMEVLVGAVVYLVVAHSPALEIFALYRAHRAAQVYALEAAQKSGADGLGAGLSFQPSTSDSLVPFESDLPYQVSVFSVDIPYRSTAADVQPVDMFGLLVDPSGEVQASSFPVRYPAQIPASQDIPAAAALIQSALAGRPVSAMVTTPQGAIASVAQPVRGPQNRVIGAVYVGAPIGLDDRAFLLGLIQGWLRSWTGWLLLMLPFGAVFGLITTRGLVRRIHRLVDAAGRFAEGDYSQRVPPGRGDEIGQLEQEFNWMAQELVESMDRQKTLSEQSARREERARIEQELHSARYIQQQLLPKEVPQLPGWQLAPFYRPAREVGGDLYDFLKLPGSRLGIVIGDVTDKGMPAALVMATTCTMLRAAAPANASPGAVLAQVNDLLHENIPEGMFATCFYGVLDPVSGRLRFANAGHDLPYGLCNGEVRELRATGLPLGLMPGTAYEEQEVTLRPEECVLFYTDGLVEAHNPTREMFGFPRLKSLLQHESRPQAMIDNLLGELQQFTGPGWEQEDDVTLVTLRRI